MKGLILKDFYTLIKQMRMFLLVIAVWACIPGFSASSFAIIYAAMLPVTAIAYDERSKWNNLAAMMPYSAADMVLSKYILGYIMVLGAAVLSIASELIVSFIRNKQLFDENMTLIILMICIAVIIQAVNLPFMFKMGVEKGRLVFFVLIAIFVIGGLTVGDSLSAISASVNASLGIIMITAVLITVVVNIISIFASIKIYNAN